MHESIFQQLRGNLNVVFDRCGAKGTVDDAQEMCRRQPRRVGAHPFALGSERGVTLAQCDAMVTGFTFGVQKMYGVAARGWSRE